MAGPSPFWRLARRRGRTIGAICLAAYTVSMLGVIPIPDLGRWLSLARAEAFPCQGHNCGCASAQDCLDHCCCYSPAERLAWAERRAAKGAHAEPKPEPVCGDPQGSAADGPAAGSCCSGDEPAPAAPEAPNEDPSALSEADWAFFISPMRCRPVDAWLLAALPFADSLASRPIIGPPPALGHSAIQSDDPGPSRPLDVATPPPRT